VDLSRHAAVLWRFRIVTAVGLGLGVMLAILASYQPTWDGGPAIKARGFETWQAKSSILVTQPGFPEGRVTLPTQALGEGVTTAGGQPAVDPTSPPEDQVEFADPARLAGLADLYSKFLTSDQVLSRVPGRPTSAQIQASPFQSSQGGLVLPVIQLTATAGTSETARRLNTQVFNSLRAVLAERQKANQIGRGKRVEVTFIDAPEAALTAGRKHTTAILAFVLCLLGTLAVTHLLASLRDRRNTEDVLASLEPWSDEESADGQKAPLAAGERDAGLRLDW
jgi:hypothetical protein